MDPMIVKKPVGRPKLRGCEYVEKVTEKGIRRKCSLTKKTNAVAEACVMSEKGRCSLKKEPKIPRVPKEKVVSLNGCMVKTGAKGDRCVRNKDSDEIDERCMKNEKGRCLLKKEPKEPSIPRVPKEKKASLNGCMVKTGAKGDRCVRNKDSDEIDERCMKNEKGRCLLKKAQKQAINMDNINIPTLTLSLDKHFEQAIMYDLVKDTYRPKNMKGLEVKVPQKVVTYIVSRLSPLRQRIEEAVRDGLSSPSYIFGEGSQLARSVEKFMETGPINTGLMTISIDTVREYLTSKVQRSVSSYEADFYRTVVFLVASDLLQFALTVPMMTNTRTELTEADVDRAIDNDPELKALL